VNLKDQTRYWVPACNNIFVNGVLAFGPNLISQKEGKKFKNITGIDRITTLLCTFVFLRKVLITQCCATVAYK